MVQNEGRVLRWTVVHKSARAMQITATLTIAIVLMSFVKRVVIDVPHLAAGTVPGGDFDRRYVTRPWLAYLHITPGVLYLLLAILQLSYRFRSRHYVTHRQLGRVAAGAAMLSGVFALIFGGLFSFGGPLEASASVVFSVWLLVTLVLAVRAIRRGDVNRHRRGMIRAFAVGTGVGTVRIWLGFFDGLGLLNFRVRSGPGLLDRLQPPCSGGRALAPSVPRPSRSHGRQPWIVGLRRRTHLLAATGGIQPRRQDAAAVVEVDITVSGAVTLPEVPHTGRPRLWSARGSSTPTIQNPTQGPTHRRWS